MTKVWALGLPLADTIRAVTASAALTAGEPGWCADWSTCGRRATLFELAANDCHRVLRDSLGWEMIPEQLIVPRGIFIDGRFQLAKYPISP